MQIIKKPRVIKLALMTLIFLFAAVNYWSLETTFAEEAPYQPEMFPYQSLLIQLSPEHDYPEEWPENQPSLLVAYYGTMVNKTGQQYNGEIELKAPVNDNNFQIHLLAEFPVSDQPEVERPYRIDKENGVIAWKPVDPIGPDEEYRFVIEYFYNPIQVKETKSFSFQYQVEGGAEVADIIISSPVGAEDISVNQQPTNSMISDFGEEIYHYQYKPLEAGKTLAYEVAYVKADHESTLSKLEKMPNDVNHTGLAQTEPASAASSAPFLNTAGAAIIGVSFIIMGVIIAYGLRGRSIALNASNISAAVSRKKDSDGQEIKQLRRLYLAGEIDEKTYNEQSMRLKDKGDDR